MLRPTEFYTDSKPKLRKPVFAIGQPLQVETRQNQGLVTNRTFFVEARDGPVWQYRQRRLSRGARIEALRHAPGFPLVVAQPDGQVDPLLGMRWIRKQQAIF